MEQILQLIFITLSTYALSSLLVHYDGAFGVFTRLRKVKPVQSVLECQVCTAFWVILPFTLLFNPFIVLAAYGLLIILVRYEP